MRQTLLADNVRRGEEAKKLYARLAEIEKENKSAAEQIGTITDYLRDNRALEEKTLRAAQSKADGLTAQMQGLQEQKRAAIESAHLPVSGLEFGDGELLLNGVPLEQLSAAEQLKLLWISLWRKTPNCA